ncbi:MAG: LapA family protein [candidate division WOR-3 bacterium]|nr:LapA family protein [candidate division WOR-3 bacterium]MDW7987315.1 LapA family protein [candidate division WOR-3 bacterium]
MTTIRIVIVFIVGILLVFLLFQNITPVSEVRLFAKTYYNSPLALVMFYSFVFGLIVAGFFWLVNEIRLRNELNKLKKENEALLAELTQLRNLPFEGMEIESTKE